MNLLILSTLINCKGFFPNNPKYPLLIYKEALEASEPFEIIKIFKKNEWKNFWTNGIYDFHHYHSNTHEVLAILKGKCKIQLGGTEGSILFIEKGDVIIIPAGVAHKNLKSSSDFVCIGAYPFDVKYDMHYGDKNESHIIEKIAKVPIPKTDPIYGNNGPLFTYWK